MQDGRTRTETWRRERTRAECRAAVEKLRKRHVSWKIDVEVSVDHRNVKVIHKIASDIRAKNERDVRL